MKAASLVLFAAFCLIFFDSSLSGQTPRQQQLMRQSERIERLDGPLAARQYLETELDRGQRSGDLRTVSAIQIGLARRAILDGRYTEAQSYAETARAWGSKNH